LHCSVKRIGDGVILDLGVLSGLVAEAVLDALPEASLVGVDFSNAMLERVPEAITLTATASF
jgi:ubiquinone/menaquinone biosynthesis C-methylase UbiE